MPKISNKQKALLESDPAIKAAWYSWQGAVRRACHKSHHKHSRYAGRGIGITARWRGVGGFDRFLVDMGPRPEGTSLDRIDNDGDYTPDNCRWATRLEQDSNTERVIHGTGIAGVRVTPNGKFVASFSRGGKKILHAYLDDFFEACCLRKSAEC